MSSQDGSYSQELGHQLLIVEVITNSLSVLGSIFIVGMYAFFQDLRTFAYKLVMLLALADIIFGISRMFNFEQYFQDEYSPELDTECYIQAYLTTFGGLSTIIATMAISWSLTQSVVYGVTDLDAYSKWYYFAIFVIPALLSIVPAVSGVYGPQGFYCWIQEDGNKPTISALIWKLCLFYIPLWISTIYNFVNYIRIWRFVKEYFSKEEDNDDIATKKQLQIIKKLTLYPLIMVVCYLFATINKIYQLFDSNQIAILFYLQYALGGLQGFFNSIVYGFNKQVKNKIVSVCPCCKQHNLSSNTSTEITRQIDDSHNNSRNESREIPSRNESSSSSIESSLTHGKSSGRTESQKQMSERLGQDLFLNYSSRPKEQILNAKMGIINSPSQFREFSYVRTETESKKDMQD